MSKIEPIYQFLQQYLPQWKAGVDQLLPHFSLLEYPKGTALIKEGQQHYNHAFFIERGAARSFYRKEATEVCTWFAFEGELLGNLQNYFGEPANETIELLEPSSLVVIDLFELKKMANTDLATSILIRNILEEHADFLEKRLQQLQFMSSMDKYQWLLTHEPSIFQRVSLTNIASYLGMSRETLSRLRQP